MRQGLWQAANVLVLAVAVLASALLVAPVLYLLAGSFWYHGPSLAHLAAVYGDPERTLVLLRNSLAVAALALAISLGLGVPLGFLLARTHLPGRRLLMLALLLAVCLPLYITSTAWTAWIGNTTWYELDWWVHKALLAGAVQGAAWLPAVALIAALAFLSGDRALEDQGLLDTTWRGVCRRISLPQAAWGLGGAVLLVLVLSLSDVTITRDLLLRTFPEETFTQFLVPDLRDTPADFEEILPWRAAAVSLPIMLLLAGLCAWFWWRWRAHGRAGRAAEPARVRQVPLGAWRWPLALAGWLVAAALLVVPLAGLVRAVGSWTNLANAWAATSLELGHTLSLAPLAATLTMLLALIWAGAMRGRLAAPLTAATILLFAMPAPLVGLSLVLCFNNHWTGWFYDSPAIVVAAWILRALPYAVLLLLPSIRRLPVELDDEAKLAGANWLQRLVLVTAPSLWRELTGVWLAGYIVSLGELGASFLVCPPGYSTLTIRFFTMIHNNVYSNVAGLCLLVLALVLLPAAVLATLLWRAFARRLP